MCHAKRESYVLVSLVLFGGDSITKRQQCMSEALYFVPICQSYLRIGYQVVDKGILRAMFVSWKCLIPL
jgi:hypothetical protein